VTNGPARCAAMMSVGGFPSPQPADLVRGCPTTTSGTWARRPGRRSTCWPMGAVNGPPRRIDRVRRSPALAEAAETRPDIAILGLSNVTATRLRRMRAGTPRSFGAEQYKTNLAHRADDALVDARSRAWQLLRVPSFSPWAAITAAAGPSSLGCGPGELARRRCRCASHGCFTRAPNILLIIRVPPRSISAPEPAKAPELKLSDGRARRAEMPSAKENVSLLPRDGVEERGRRRRSRLGRPSIAPAGNDGLFLRSVTS